jgi:hypothetical protein
MQDLKICSLHSAIFNLYFVCPFPNSAFRLPNSLRLRVSVVNLPDEYSTHFRRR